MAARDEATSMGVESRVLGASGREVSALGVGVWAWGDRRFWGYGKSYTVEDIKAAYRTARDAGITLFDTAEVYGMGRSETLLGRCARADGRPVVIASKFAPLPYRLTARSLLGALDASLARLDRSYLDLYQIHWPYTLLPINALMDAMAEAARSGKIRAVGVSNYNPRQMEQAHDQLARHGLPLASNQVRYSLLDRHPEASGLMDACRRLNVALIAYSPLGQGILTGKYTEPDAIKAPLLRRFSGAFRTANSPKTRALVEGLRTIATAREVTSGQVALNWLLCRDRLVIPIPGAKTAWQAARNAGALGWRLTEDEQEQLDRLSLPWRR